MSRDCDKHGALCRQKWVGPGRPAQVLSYLRWKVSLLG